MLLEKVTQEVICNIISEIPVSLDFYIFLIKIGINFLRLLFSDCNLIQRSMNFIDNAK